MSPCRKPDDLFGLLMIEQQISLLFWFYLGFMKCDKKGSHRKCITIFVWIPMWRDHSGKVKKNSQNILFFIKTSESNHFEQFTSSRETASSYCVKILWRMILVWQHLSPRRHFRIYQHLVLTWSFDYTYRLYFHSMQWSARQGCLLHIVKELQINCASKY